MGSTVKLANDLYLETSSIVHNGKLLSNILYPIGSIYLSVNSINPTNFFGGTWEQIKDKFLLSAGDTYTAGSTGGSADAIVVSHTHGTGSNSWTSFAATNTAGAITRRTVSSGSGVSNVVVSDEALNNDITKIQTVGSSGTNKNMPPYLAVYVWKRIS